MKQELYIHIGMPKTGTTGLQFFLHQNRQALLKQGVYYPVTMREPQPTATQHRFVNEYLRRLHRDGPASLRGLPNPIRILPHEITRRAAPKNVISEELFSYDPEVTASYLSGLKATLDCKIVVFVRRQDTWAESMYAQSIRGGYRENFDRFLNAKHNQERLNLLTFCEIWERHFGEGNVIVKRYIDRETNSQGELMKLLGVDHSVLNTAEQRNKSLSAEAISFLKGMRSLHEGGYPKFNRLFGEHLADTTKRGSTVLFSPEKRAAFLAKYVKTNDELVRRFIGEDPAKTPLFTMDPEKFPSGDTIMKDLTLTRRIEILESILSLNSITFDAATKAGSTDQERVDYLMDVIEDHIKGSSVAV